MIEPVEDGGEFARQAAIARNMGSHFVVRILDAGLRQLGRAPRTAALIRDWPANRGDDAVALRFNGALHALAMRAGTPALAALYRDLDGDFDAVLADTLAREDDFIANWMAGPPQTNEVGRAAAIMAALAAAAGRFGLPFELLELGSSAGLNLNLARYGYDLGGVRAGDPGSTVQITPEWRGGPPPPAPVQVRSVRGVDVAPLDVGEEAARERLLAYVWADDLPRARRLEAAIAIARAHPPRIDRDDAADWVAARLAKPQDEGVCRAVFHSIVLQYLSPKGRAAVRSAIEAAGGRATASRPLAWISYEWDAARSKVVLRLTTWPDGAERELATCQAHSAWIEWRTA